MLASQALCVSRVNEARETHGLSSELRAYVKWEYGGEAPFVAAQIGRANGVRSARKEEGFGRAALRALAKLPEALAAAFANPGGA